MISFQKKSARLARPELFLEAVPLGKDWQLTLSGGVEHVGAVALAEPGRAAEALFLPGHCEGPISQELAALCAEKLHCRIAFCSGIHYDDITKDEIEEVLFLARAIVGEFLAWTGNKNNIL